MRRALMGLVAVWLVSGVDARADFLDWTMNARASNSGSVNRSNLDGTGQTSVLSGLNSPLGIAVGGGKICWGDAGTLQSANLDGSGQVVLDAGAGFHTGVALDLADGKVFFANESQQTLYSLPIAGGSPIPLATGLSGV